MLQLLNENLRPRTDTVPAEPEVWFFEHYGERILFDANSLCAARMEEPTYSRLKALCDAAGRETARARRAPEGIGGLLFSRKAPKFLPARTTPVRRVVLNVTHGCNLACAYCFRRQADGVNDSVRSDGSVRSEMTAETAMKAVALIAPGLPLDVAFFGGEPLTAWRLVRRVMEETQRLAARRKVRAKFHATTNGVLLDEEKAAFLAAQPCSLLVSLDGPQELHDAARPTREGGGSFAATMAALDRLAAAKGRKRPMARATFLVSEPRLVERLEFLAGLEEAGLIGGFSVEPAVIGEGCAGRSGLMDRGLLAREYHAAAEWYVARLAAGRPAGFFHFRKLTERIRLGRHAGSECGAGNGYVTVAPDGMIHACHREGTPVGRVDSGFDEQRRAEWRDNRMTGRVGCMRCWARYVCGGGCRQARIEVGGGLTARTPDLCFLKRTMARECLWILAKDTERRSKELKTED